MNRFAPARPALPALALSTVLLAALAACGGGATAGADSTNAALAAEGTPSTVSVTDAAAGTPDAGVAAALAATEVAPAYHLTPALLDEPDQRDVGGTNASARGAPARFEVDEAVLGQGTARLTRQDLAQRLAAGSKARIAAAGGAAPQARTLVGAVYTPAQIRAAYGLIPLPSAGTTLTPDVAAQLGAGQTIYLIDAYHDATALADLNAFSTRFGLPTCTNVAIATTAALPLAAPPSTCTFSAVYSSTRGTMTTTVPAYNATWAPESKLDVQWAHAIAPLARIVLVEMPSAMSNAILDANTLAARMGPGVVSMSFGSVEASWSSSVDSYFAGAGMSTVAAAGDSGTQVLWPAVSPNVVAVGGTGMNWSGTGARYEQAWSGSGGGMSAYVALPSWQSGVTPAGGSALVRRAVPDVAFNANPMTGEYVALTLPGASTVWSAYGGTSIAAPQWAGVIAVANALRAASGKAALGDIHAQLYKSIAPVPGTYAAAFGDIVDGSNGSCATCKAGTGFDQATGWGTPNATQLLPVLSGSAGTLSVSAAPTVPGGSFTGAATTAFSKSLNIAAPAGTTTRYALSGAPAGLSVDAGGTLQWARPVAGSYAFTATATTTAGKSASGRYTLQVIPGTAPVFSSSGRYSGSTAGAFSGTLSASNPNGGTLAFSLAGAPAGLVAGSSGTLAWAAPVAGSYTFTAKVADSYGYSSTQSVTLAVTGTANANHAPTVTATALAEPAGATFAARLLASDPDGDAITLSMTGAPAGVTLLGSGVLTGSSSARGRYAITVTARDTHGATGSAIVTLAIQ